MLKKYCKTIISILFAIISIVLSISVYNINLLPTKYFVLFVGIIAVLNVISALLLKSKKIWTKIISVILYIIITIMSIVGLTLTKDVDNFLDKSFNNAEKVHKIEYYVMSKKEILENDLNKKDIYYSSSDINIGKALNVLIEKYKTVNKVVNEDNDLFKKEIFIINRPLFDTYAEMKNGIKKDDYKIIYKFTIEVELDNKNLGEEEENTEEVQQKKLKVGEYYNIFVGGYDFTNTFMDFNMLVSINKDNKEILLTSIPRDYYITDAFVGKKDKLSDMGARGITTNAASVAKLFGIKVDYYVKVNTSSLVTLVNSVGGITYCSDVAYTTSHAKILDSYDDTKGEKLYVKKGCQHLNGIEALTVARERLAFKSGDIQRQKNCVKILKAIGDKVSISNYTKIMSAVSGSYTTTMDKDFMTEMLKTYLSDPSWKINSQTLTGSHSNNYIFFTTQRDYVMNPNQGSVSAAKSKIQEMKYKK